MYSSYEIRGKKEDTCRKTSHCMGCPKEGGGAVNLKVPYSKTCPGWQEGHTGGHSNPQLKENGDLCQGWQGTVKGRIENATQLRYRTVSRSKDRDDRNVPTRVKFERRDWRSYRSANVVPPATFYSPTTGMGVLLAGKIEVQGRGSSSRAWGAPIIVQYSTQKRNLPN
jgi:hypothetical protein